MRYEELKIAIMDDLEVCIGYEPSKETDLLFMMEQYLKSKEKRQKLLPQIKNCIDHKPYQNPFSVYDCYTKEDIRTLGEILDDYMERMKKSEEVSTTIRNTICQINELHEHCGGELIDDWRRP